LLRRFRPRPERKGAVQVAGAVEIQRQFECELRGLRERLIGSKYWDLMTLRRMKSFCSGLSAKKASYFAAYK